MSNDYKTIEDKVVVDMSHPPVIETLKLATGQTADVKAGTLVTVASGVATPAGAAEASPRGVVARFTPKDSTVVLVLMHGMCVRSNIINSAGGAASAAQLASLDTHGVYACN